MTEMSDSNTFENAQLLLIFNNTDITGIGDAGGLRGSASAGSLYLAAYTRGHAAAAASFAIC